MENKNTNEELEYFQNKLKETMGKGLPKKYLETTDLGEVDKLYSSKTNMYGFESCPDYK